MQTSFQFWMDECLTENRCLLVRECGLLFHGTAHIPLSTSGVKSLLHIGIVFFWSEIFLYDCGYSSMLSILMIVLRSGCGVFHFSMDDVFSLCSFSGECSFGINLTVL